MYSISKEEFEHFAKSEFPGSPYYWGEGYCYIQAGTCMGKYLHYEYNADKVHLDIEGKNWRPLRDYLRKNLKDPNISGHHWVRYDCRWTLERTLNNSEDVMEAFRTIRYILEPHILGFESQTSEYTLNSENNEFPIDAHFVNFDELFNKDLVIPEYQRPYRWNENNVFQLLNDINTSLSDGKQYYLIGSIILHEDCSKSIFNIVDGQQRITTLLLLLKRLGYTGTLPDLKFNHTDSFYNICHNFDVIESWLNLYVSDRQSFLAYLLDSCQFVQITVKKLSEAFQMFESQNGRGKELEPYNLLKAYHIRAMVSNSKDDKVACDTRWENAAMYLSPQGFRKDILKQLFDEQLYRTRVWSRGTGAYPFTKRDVDEFKGLTIDNANSLEFAYQNSLLQKDMACQIFHFLNPNNFKIKSRFIHGDPDNMDPFAFINQMVLNGKSFFDYIETYVEIYKRIFLELGTSQMTEFKEFYQQRCLYDGYECRVGDGYVRQVYKSAIMLVFDRFGERGVMHIYENLYRCIYRFRLENKQVRYETMAKASNVSWIFTTINNAKNLSDLNVFMVRAHEKIKVIYELAPVKEVYF